MERFDNLIIQHGTGGNVNPHIDVLVLDGEKGTYSQHTLLLREWEALKKAGDALMAQHPGYERERRQYE